MTQGAPVGAPAADASSPLERTHRTLRAAMLQLLVRMIEFPRGVAYERDQLIDDLDGVLYLCESHAANEEHVLASVIDRIRPRAYDELRDAHRNEERAIDALRGACADWLEREEREAAEALLVLFREFTGFIVRTLVHFAREEQALSSLASSKLSTEELLRTYAELDAVSGPEERISFSRIAREELAPAFVSQRTPWLAREAVREAVAQLAPFLTRHELATLDAALTRTSA